MCTFVPIYFKKLQVVGLSPDKIFIAEEQRDAALSQYFDGYSRIVDLGPWESYFWSTRMPVQI